MAENTNTGDMGAMIAAMDAEFWWSNFGVIYNVQKAREELGPTPNKMQERIFSHYRKCQVANKPCKIMILKPRRKGASTVAQGLIYYHIRKYRGLRGLMMGDMEDTSDNIMSMFRLYAQRDRYPWPDGQGGNIAPEGDQVREVQLTNTSFIRRMTAGSKNAGRSFGGQVAHWDEEAHYPVVRGHDPMLASLQVFDETSAFSLGIRSSTPNGPAGAFYDDWRNPNNDWEKIFAAWFDFDDSWMDFESEDERRKFEESMDEDEREEQARYALPLERMKWRRYTIENKCKGDVDKYRQEYASDPISCFNLSARPKYSLGSLAEMRRAMEQRHDIERGDLVVQDGQDKAAWERNERGGSVEICEQPREGQRYVVAIDTCSGEDQQLGGAQADPDWHSIGVWRDGHIDPMDHTWHIPRMVAHHRSQIDSDLLVEIAAGMSLHYGRCLVVPEVNGEAGHHVIKLLLKKNIPVYKRKMDPNIMKKTLQERIEAYGWRTTTPTRKYIVDLLVKPVRDQEVELSFPVVYHEFERFMVNHAGKAEALPGEHDDTVLQSCIGYANLRLAREFSSIKKRSKPRDVAKKHGFAPVNKAV